MERIKKVQRSLLCLFLAITLIFSGTNVTAAQESETKKEDSAGQAGLTQESVEVFKNSYDSLTSRITDRGYAATSLTGTYNGMFPRDSSIQAMMYTQFGDLDNAKKILNFLLTYNQGVGLDYMGHILDNYQDEKYGNTYLGYDPTGTEESYYQQTTNSRLLFMIKNETNKAAQPFSVPFTQIEKVRIGLNNKVDGDKILVRIMRDYQDESTEVASKELTLEGAQSDDSCIWREIVFDEPVTVYSNARYYLVVEQPETNGYIAWGGIDATGSFEAVNYDNGWAESGSKNITAFEIIGTESSEDTYFSSQANASSQLYKINGENNAVAQPFTAGYEEITGVKAYLEKTYDTDHVTVKLMEDYQDDTTVVASKEYTFNDNPSGWQYIQFDERITLEKGKLYYLFIQGSEDSGKIVWDGIREKNINGVKNYDKETYGGWVDEDCTTAFEIVYDTDISEKPFAQKFALDDDSQLTGVYVSLQAELEGGDIIAEIRSDLDGAALASSSTAILKGSSEYYFSFETPMEVQKNIPYYIVLKAQGNDGSVYWETESGSQTDSSYFNDGSWQRAGLSLHFEPIILEEGILELGGSHTASQEINTFDSETITAVEIQIQKEEGISGNLTAVLYKKTDEGLQFVDKNTVDITDKKQIDTVRFVFGLPLEKITDKTSNYVLEVTAPELEEGCVKWLGSLQSSELETMQDGIDVEGEASYEAFKSEIQVLSNAQQVDGNYSVILSWCRFVEAAKEDSEYEAKYEEWVEKSYPIVADLANYYLKETDEFQQNGFYTEWNLMFNPSIEHTRQENYHEGYDLMTNVFISQALYELSEIGNEFGDIENTKVWEAFDSRIVDGVSDHLVVEVNGKNVYKELHGAQAGDKEGYKDIIGYSWINIAPLAVDWHATDWEIMKNTYEEYKRLGTVNIDETGDFNDYHVLDSCIFVTDDGMELNKNTGLNDGHWDSGFTGYVIGKGWAWELIYNKEVLQDDERVDELIEFQLNHLTEENLYIEFWWWNDYRGEKHRYSDPGNQEHSSWQLYALSRIYPTLRKSCGIDLEEYNALLKQVGELDEQDYTEATWTILQQALEAAKTVLAESDLLQAEVDIQVQKITEAVKGLKDNEDISTEKEMPGQQAIELYKNTYDSLTGRITERGYAQTSLTGLYSGMFPRDASIQAMALSNYGDLDNAQKILNFLLTYNQEIGNGYMAHILNGFEDEAYGNTYEGYDPTGTEESFYSQLSNTKLLFKIAAGTNKAGQPFSVPFDQIEKVRIQLTNEVDGDKIVVRILKDYLDDTSEVARKEIVLNGAQNDGSCVWREAVFDTPVTVYPNSRYYLVIEQPEENGYIACGGIDAEGDFLALNYDMQSYGGWGGSHNNIMSFEIVGNGVDIFDTYYSSQSVYDSQLFMVNGENNAAAQPFVPGYSRIDGVKAYLSKTNDTDTITVKIMKDYRDDTTTVAETEYTFMDNPGGWQTILFDETVVLETGQRYYLYIQAGDESGKVVWYGITQEDGYGAKNYDLSTYQGWRDEENTTAFDVIYEMDLSEQLSAQSFIPEKDGILKGVYVNLDSECAGGQVTAELRESLGGGTLADASAVLSEGKKSYYFTFPEEVSLEGGRPYYVVLNTYNAEGKVQWSYSAKGLSSDAPSYLNNGEWEETDIAFDLTPIVAKDGILKIGGSRAAVQEIKTLDSESITAVEIEIEKHEQTEGILVGKLYKKTEDGLLYIDESEVDITEKNVIDKVRFEFGFPLQKIEDRSADYVLEVTAPSMEQDSVTWLGNSGIDFLGTWQEDESVSGEASYEAFRTTASTRSSLIQVDGNYSVVLSWCRFVEAAKKDPDYEEKYREWIEQSFPLVSDLVNYYLETGDLKNQGGFDGDKKLFFNPSIEHTRDSSYHEGYDLITNSFASQAMYELVPIAEELGYQEDADKWMEIDKMLVEGINEFLTTELNGKTIYSEMYGSKMGENVEYYCIKGFSWVNFGPLAVQWHGMDQEIMANTYDEYVRLGSSDYFGHIMLDACIFLNADETGLDYNRGVDNSGKSKHVIGKGWSWELIYQNDIENYGRVNELMSFSNDLHPENNVYTESWWDKDTEIYYSDPGNQEHASWQFFAVGETFPTMTKSYGIHLEEYDKIMEQIDSLSENEYTEATWTALQQAVDTGRTVLAEDDLIQAEVDLQVKNISEALNGLVERADINQLAALIEYAEGIDLDDFTDESAADVEYALETAKSVAMDLNATQAQVDEAYNKLKEAIDNLQKNVCDKTRLNELIAEYESIDWSGYTKESRENMESVLIEAKTVAADEEMTADDQGVIDAMVNKLEQTKEAMKKMADFTELKALIEKADEIEVDKYTEQSVKVLLNVLEEAEQTAANDNLSTEDQAAVDVIAERLSEAIESLEEANIPEDEDKKTERPADQGNNNGSDEKKNDAGKQEAVKTGDENNTIVFFIFLAGTAAITVVFAAAKRKSIR